MIFTDSMQIPVGAPHAFTAQKIMDFVYDPKIAGADHGIHQLRAAGEGRRREILAEDATRRSPRAT